MAADLAGRGGRDLQGRQANVHRNLKAAFESNYADYRDTVPHVFHHNAAVMSCDEGPAPDNLSAMIEERGFTHLPPTFHHAERTGNLPVHHEDPFDRHCGERA